MINFINNLFKSKKETFKDKTNFKELVSNKEIQDLFKSFNTYSDETELRFVGGCVRKLINDEIVDDIDLSTNLKPETIIEILKKIISIFMKLELNMEQLLPLLIIEVLK